VRDFVAQRRERRSGDRGRRSGGTAACEAGPTETGLYVLAAKAVEENALDVALVTMPASGRMLEVTPVMDDEFVAIFPPGEVDLPAQATPALLASRPLVLYEPGANTRRIVDD